MVKIPRSTRAALIGTGTLALTAAASATVVQRRHIAAIKRDPDRQRLENPPRGRVVEVTSADGTKLHAEVFGPDGAAPVVLAHGWTEALEYWTFVIEDLVTAGHRVIGFDHRGHGLSGQAAGGDYSIQRFGEDLEAVLDTCTGRDERAIVAGHSLGGMTIVAWAQAHDVAARIRGAALCMTGMDGLISDSLILPLPVIAGRVKETIGRGFMGSGGSLPQITTPLSHASIRYIAFGPDVSAARVAFYEQMLWRTHPKARTAIGIALSDLDIATGLERLTVPTVVLAGDVDRLTPPVHAERMAKRLPAARSRVIERCGHMGPLEHPHEVSRAIRELAE